MGKKIRIILLVDLVFSLLCTGFATMMSSLEDRTLTFNLEAFVIMFVFTYLLGLASLLGWYGKKMPGVIMAISLISAALAGGGLGFIASGKIVEN